MTRYLVGRRGKEPSLVVVDKPPTFVRLPDGWESAYWCERPWGFVVRGNKLVESRTNSGAPLVARAFPEDFAADYEAARQNVADARAALDKALRDEQELLQAVAMRAKPLNVSDLRAARRAEAAAQTHREIKVVESLTAETGEP